MKITIIIPVYKSPDSLVELHLRLVSTLLKITNEYEIIFVDDCSPMNDWEIIKQIANKDNNVKGILFSRNFGQHNAIYAGLQNATGEAIVVMDCDLQDKPEEIGKLYDEYTKGFDLVVGSRENRNDKFIKRLFSRIFYKVLSYLTETEQEYSVGNFGIYSKKVIESLLLMNDYIKYFPTMVKWVGYKKSTVKIEHSERLYGRTSYNFKNLTNLAISTILSFSDKPLRLVIKLGLSVSFIAIILGFYYFFQYFYGNVKVIGWVSSIISVWFLSGIIIIVLGIVGLYTGRIFEKVKDRPIYISKERINFRDYK